MGFLGLANATEASDSEVLSISRLERLVWLILLLGQLIAAALWWWLQPGGFPWNHPRFWINRVIPVIAMCWSLGSLLALHRENRLRLAVWLPAWPAVWAALAIASKLVFPVTVGMWWLMPIAGAAGIAAWLIPGYGRLSQVSRRRVLASICAWSLIGFATPFGERPPAPGTRPLLASLPEAEVTAPPVSQAAPGAISLGRDVMVYTSDGSLSIRMAPLTVRVSPLLSFISQSPDGCWTVLAPAGDRGGPEPRLRGVRQQAPDSWLLGYDFRGQGPALLNVVHAADRRSVVIDAATRLEQLVFSHLNSFCDLEVRGHHRLSLEFSPCPDSRIQVTRFDYPFGRPARFAYVDGDRRFRVVEASSGEKGPFRILAEGRLSSADALSITLFDQDRKIGRITLHDWSAQVSTQLSPTAGWNVPVNAIEFSLSGDAPTSPASIFITLAGTSVGRGWDSVGHAAGTYRNQITLEPW
jgi:hypothetical protein